MMNTPHDGQDSPQLTHDPSIKGTPRLDSAHPRYTDLFRAKFLCRCRHNQFDARHRSDPAFRKVDVDIKTGKVKGLHEVD